MKTLLESVEKVSRYTIFGHEGELLVDTKRLMDSDGYKRQAEALKKIKFKK